MCQMMHCIWQFKNYKKKFLSWQLFGIWHPKLLLKYKPHTTRAANNFSLSKGHMSDQVSILVGQIEMWSGVSCFNYNFLRGSLFEIIISYHYLLIIWLKCLSGHNVPPKSRFRRTSADFSRTLYNDRRLFAALYNSTACYNSVHIQRLCTIIISSHWLVP